VVHLKAGKQELFEHSLDREENIKIVSQSPVMRTLIDKIKNISSKSKPVFIIGENGSGKKMIAKEIFKTSVTHNDRLVEINLSGMTPDLMEIHLFNSKDKNNHLSTHTSYLSNLKNTTVLIQNIDAMPLNLQSKLLKFFQENNNVQAKNECKFRVIATAHNSISQKIEKGEFREDLFFYLNQTLFIMPSLVERQEDIPELLKIFLDEHNFRGTLEESAINKLKHHSWRGNVLELRNICIQIASLHNDQVIDEHRLPIYSVKDLNLALFVKYNPKIKLDDLVNYYIAQSLKHFKSKKKSAESLNISVKTIYNKLEQGLVKIN